MKNPEFNFYDKTSLKSYNLDQSMQYQLNMLGNLDVFTRKHCENVASITCRICEYLHLGKAFTEYCTICAYLHDIGKMFIPPKVLQKPGKLTDEEFEIMKTHTTIGYNMCMKDLKLRPYAAGPYYHHEALDGSGYPQGLKKEDIPYEAQIIRVADEYDAIVSKRQYKSHIGISDTIKILIENAQPRNKGSKFGKNNPKLVKCLIKVVICDIEYEISGKMNYIDYIKDDLKRMVEIDKYIKKMEEAKNEKNRNYYLEGAKMLLKPEETIENFAQTYSEAQESLEIRKKELDHLWDEIKIIKKLKV